MYSITFVENGGTTQTDLTEQTALPTPLPTPTKSGYTFVNWYYDSSFTQKATAGDTLESNVTLYAKWHNLGSLFTEIADAIRSKDGTSENIRDVDFPEQIEAIPTGPDVSGDTATPADVLIGKTFHAGNNEQKTGTAKTAKELTQAQYDALSTKDSNTYYLIVEE